MLTVIGMGIGTVESITLGALTAMEQAEKVVLQTDRVPAAQFIKNYGIEYETIDDIYAEAEDFDELCELAAERINEGVFCVMGSISSNLIAQAVIAEHPDCKIISGVSFGEDALSRCKLSSEAVQVISASAFMEAHIETDSPVVITEVDNPFKAADIALKLERFSEQDCFVIMGEHVKRISVGDIKWEYDDAWGYNCAIVLPPLKLEDKNGYTLNDLTKVMERLRGLDGCPWDKKQTHRSLRQYILEESYEVIDAIDAQDDFALADELGDVLFQIAFHTRIGEEQSSFDMLDVTTAACKKMISRHTHIFGDDKIDTAEGVSKNWEQIKRMEKGQKTLAESMNDATELSPVVRTTKMQKKAALDGLGINDKAQAIEKLIGDIGRLCAQATNDADTEISGGDTLFSVINLLRLCGVSAEAALHAANRRFLEQAK